MNNENIDKAKIRVDKIHEEYGEKEFIIDLESRPQPDLVSMCEGLIVHSKTLKDPVKIEADIEKKKKGLRKTMSVDTDLAEIICVGIKEIGKEPKLYTLEEMEKWFEDNERFKFISFNGKKFDLPLLIKQGLKHKLNFPYRKLKDMCRKYQINGHYDLMEIINDGEWKSLDTLLQIYCGVSKKPVNFETASEQEIKEHCLEDIINTELIYNVFKPIL